MARKEGGFIRGKMGGYIYRVRNGKQEIYPEPDRRSVKQTAATKRAAGAFATAASIGKKIRHTVSGEIRNSGDASVVSRLTGQLSSVLAECKIPGSGEQQFQQHSFSRLNGFEYNETNRVEQLMLLRPEVSIAAQQMSVHIPALAVPSQFKFPGDSFHCTLRLVVSLIRLPDFYYQNVAQVKELVVVKSDATLPEQVLLFDVPDGCLCLTSIFLFYSASGKRGWENLKNFYPGSICAAVVSPGVFTDKGSGTWLPHMAV